MAELPKTGLKTGGIYRIDQNLFKFLSQSIIERLFYKVGVADLKTLHYYYLPFCKVKRSEAARDPHSLHQAKFSPGLRFLDGFGTGSPGAKLTQKTCLKTKALPIRKIHYFNLKLFMGITMIFRAIIKEHSNATAKLL